ncbi:MAG: tRNA lysidine(34) synthetase TilS [Betaproteobacteria bacterium]|nr:MAG: tRNA lysidine(34) synthetase TilS [Betaproteobacteria bacterium]
MASSRKSKPNSVDALEATVRAALEPLLFPRARLVLSLSGGLDSMVLLELLRRLAGPLDFRLACIHINHNISPNARLWAAFCARRCKRHDIALALHQVDIGPHRAEGVEAAARRVRYQVYAAQSQADFIVLAQHLDDQAETLLLQLLRGAGVKGGASMPLIRDQHRGGKRTRAAAILRPMLGLARTQIESYARARKLKWVEDESNQDTRYDRNFLRHRVFPIIEQAFPGYRATLGRAARHLAEASRTLDLLAEDDAKRALQDGTLEVAELRRLGSARSKNLLRWLLQRQGAAAPEADRLQEALRQLLEAGDDASVRVALGASELRRYAGRAYLLPSLPQPPADLRCEWDGKRLWSLPQLGGALHFERRTGAGLGRLRVGEFGLNLRLRQGGEKLRLRAKGSTRSLKNLLQEMRLPPWERERLPLIYCADTLVAVPGLGVASGWEAGAGESGWQISWRPHD